MSAAKVLDSYSVIAYLENEPGGAKVADLIKQARERGNPLLLSVVNWGEVYYSTCRVAGQSAAERVLQQIDTLPIEIVDADRETAKVAATLKTNKKMSYADCFAAALAILRKAQMVTGDREFKEVEDRLHVLWL